MSTWILDRFEGDKAVLEEITSREITVFTRGALPPETREGDVIVWENGRYSVDSAATEARRADINARFARLKRR